MGVTLIDRYVLGARVAPVVVIALFLFLAVSAWIPFNEWPIKLLGGSAVLSIGAFVLAQVARDAGKAIEGPLWDSWGGPPTMQMLRHRDQTIEAGSKALLHRKLIALEIVDRLPTPIDEAADPAAADAQYRTCSDWLRRKALELKAKTPFDIVHSENITYGFRRNLLGIRPYGMMVFTVSITTTIVAFFFHRNPYIELVGIVLVGAYIVIAVNPEFVKRAAYDYSRRLLDAAQSLQAPTSKKTAVRPKPRNRFSFPLW